MPQTNQNIILSGGIRSKIVEKGIRHFVSRRCHTLESGRASNVAIHQAARDFFLATDEDILSTILDTRANLAGNQTWIETIDFGSGKRTLPAWWMSGGKPNRRQISEIYQRSAIPHPWGCFLFHLTRFLEPTNILELGTNLGVSALYFQRAIEILGRGSTLTTIEGDPTMAGLARKNLDSSNGNVRVVQGAFRDRLPEVLGTGNLFSLVFVDGHHDEEAAIQYVDMIKPHLNEGAVVILDDTEPWARHIRKAWNYLRSTPDVADSIDLIKMGILIFR